MKWLKDYFDLSRKEEAGFIGLLGIMAVLFALQFFMVYFVPAKKTDFSNLQKIAKQLQSEDMGLTTTGSGKSSDLSVPKKALTVPVDLNTADSIKLITIKGIGPAFAGRILAFRRRLGCFMNVEQLTDIHGIGTEKYGILKPQVCLSKGHPKYLNINGASVDDLISNPYIGYKLANAIVQYRTSHGRFSSVEDLKKKLAIDTQTWQKIMPYITI